MDKLNEMLIRRKGLVILPASHYGVPMPHESPVLDHMPLVMTFNKNLQDIGYTMAPTLMGLISRAKTAEVTSLLNDILAVVKVLKGVENYRPMYPNFPQQVIDMDEAKLYWNAVISYFSDFVADITDDRDYIWMPKYKKDKREPLDEKVKLCVLKVGNEDDLKPIATQLLSSNTSLSETDKADLRTLVASAGNVTIRFFPLTIPNKETLAFLGSLFFETKVSLEEDYMVEFMSLFTTATDVLRLAVALSGGDISLAKPCKFRSFKRVERCRLFRMLRGRKNLEEDMLRWEGRWIRLAERLHPGDYWKEFPDVYSAIQAVRNNNTAQTFRSKVEESVRGGHVKDAIELLSTRPGEFGRRLDHLVRKARTKTAKTEAIRGFLDVAEAASTPVLLQMMAHFDHRQDGNEDGMERVIFPKGNVAKVMTIPALPPIAEEHSKLAARGIRNVLRKRFSELPAMGNVYVDPELKHYLLPFSQRSASKSLRTLVRGSHASFGYESKNTIRLFLWWKEPKGGMQTTYDDSWTTRVDLDLSAVFFDENWNFVDQTTYYNLKGAYSCHSGDIRSAPKGASEFIDIDIAKAQAHNVRYVVTTVHGFTPQGFNELPECFVGWMLRAEPQSGEIYDPRTVEDRADLTCEARSGVPFIADLKERRVIWCDAAMGVNEYSRNNVDSTKGTIRLLGKALSNVNKATVYDLLVLHAKGRGKLVDDRKDADVEFSVRKGTQFELERLASEFMVDAPKKAKAQTATA